MSTLIERLRWLANSYLRDEDLVYNDKAFGLCNEVRKAADHIEQLERKVRNAQGAVVIAKEWIAEKDAKIEQQDARIVELEGVASEALRHLHPDAPGYVEEDLRIALKESS